MTSKVYVVECRYYNEYRHMECDLAYLASSKEKAAKWCKNHANYSLDDFWWAIYEMYMDDDDVLNVGNELHYRSLDGKVLQQQPCRLYDEPI